MIETRDLAFQGQYNEDPRTKLLIQELGRVQNQVKAHADSFGRRAKAQQWATAVSRIIMATLGVAAPTIVTYQVQSKTPDPTLSIIAIIITALAGSVGALQAAFRWSDAYARSLQTQLALLELDSLIGLQKIAFTHTNNSHRYADARSFYERTVRELRRILKEDVEAEVALISQEVQQKARSIPTNKKE